MSDQQQQHVYIAICKVQAALAVDGIAKIRKNEQQGYVFRGIDDIYNALAALLAEHRLCVLPRMISRDVAERTSNKGNALFYVTVAAEYDLVSAEDGSKHVIRAYGEGMDSGDKATNKAMSAAYKYAMMQTFAIPTEGESDGDAITHTVKPKAEPPPNKGMGTISPTDGAWDACDDDTRKRLAFIADCVKAEFSKSGPAAAWAIVDAESLDTDEHIALWSRFAGDSKMRSAMKAERARQRANPPGLPQPEGAK